tara:strand:- start:398 stop:586 length:189 start_codon:yes stop_codon:yes gene_type:complete
MPTKPETGTTASSLSNLEVSLPEYYEVDESELFDWLTQAIHPGEYRAGGGQKALAKNRQDWI